MDKDTNVAESARAGLLKKDAPWIVAIVIIAGLLALNAGPHHKDSSPPHPFKKGAARYLTPRPKPALTEGQQLDVVLRQVGGVGDDDMRAWAERELADSVLDAPSLGVSAGVKAVTVSARGEVRISGAVSIPRGRLYQYVLFGPDANLILIKLGRRTDGSREFGLGTYQ